MCQSFLWFVLLYLNQNCLAGPSKKKKQRKNCYSPHGQTFVLLLKRCYFSDHFYINAYRTANRRGEVDQREKGGHALSWTLRMWTVKWSTESARSHNCRQKFVFLRYSPTFILSKLSPASFSWPYSISLCISQSNQCTPWYRRSSSSRCCCCSEMFPSANCALLKEGELLFSH